MSKLIKQQAGVGLRRSGLPLPSSGLVVEEPSPVRSYCWGNDDRRDAAANGARLVHSMMMLGFAVGLALLVAVPVAQGAAELQQRIASALQVSAVHR